LELDPGHAEACIDNPQEMSFKTRDYESLIKLHQRELDSFRIRGSAPKRRWKSRGCHEEREEA
jgi:hypothetical protein